MIVILILAVLAWLGGYFATTYKMSSTGLIAKELEKIVAPPKWLYYLCGAPRSQEYPRGTMRVSAFRAQILGIIWMIYIIYSRIWKTSETENIISLALGLAVAFLITWYVSKQYYVRDQAKNRKKKKNT